MDKVSWTGKKEMREEKEWKLNTLTKHQKTVRTYIQKVSRIFMVCTPEIYNVLRQFGDSNVWVERIWSSSLRWN